MKLPAIIITFTAVLLTQNIFAGGQQQSLCPTVALIVATGVDTVEQSNDGSFAACKISNYGTKGEWLFLVGPFTAQSQADALQKAGTALPALVFSSESNSPPWPACEYKGHFEGEEIFALAIPGNNENQLKRSGCRIFF